MENILKEKLFEKVETEKENLCALIQRLIQIKSYSGEEKEQRQPRIAGAGVARGEAPR